MPRPRRHLAPLLLAALAGIAVILALPGPVHREDQVAAAPFDGATVNGQETTPGATGPAGAEGSAPSAPPTGTLAPTAVAAPAPIRRVPSRTMAENAIAFVPPVEALEGYVWPIRNPRLTLPFGPTPWGSRWVDGQAFHDGVDLASYCGDRVYAAHDGVVIAAGRHYDDEIGWVGSLDRYYRRLNTKHLWYTLPIVVVIDDGNGYRSMYAHMRAIIVKTGDIVTAGQRIGYEGATGRASGCHLHYGLYSPWETAVFAIKADVAERMQFPPAVIARIDPLLVLPPKPGVNAPATPKPTRSPAASPPAPAGSVAP